MYSFIKWLQIILFCIKVFFRELFCIKVVSIIVNWIQNKKLLLVVEISIYCIDKLRYLGLKFIYCIDKLRYLGLKF